MKPNTILLGFYRRKDEYPVSEGRDEVSCSFIEV